MTESLPLNRKRARAPSTGCYRPKTIVLLRSFFPFDHASLTCFLASCTVSPRDKPILISLRYEPTELSGRNLLIKKRGGPTVFFNETEGAWTELVKSKRVTQDNAKITSHLPAYEKRHRLAICNENRPRCRGRPLLPPLITVNTILTFDVDKVPAIITK